MTQIYLSYAYVDNQDFQGQRGWINDFREDLENTLSFASGRILPITFFHNKQFDKPNLLTIKYIQSTQLFLIIGTPAYFYSDYCQSELKLFLKRQAPNIFQQIIYVSKIPCEETNLLSRIPIDHHFQFYDLKGDIELSRIHQSEKYFSKIEKIAKQILIAIK